MFIKIFEKKIPIESKGQGEIPLLILGPASLFKKPRLLPNGLFQIFKIFFVDIFAKTDSSSLNYNQISLNDFIEAINNIRLSLGFKKIALFAHSASGVLAFMYARNYPENVHCNIIVASSPFWGNPKESATKSFFHDYNVEEKRMADYASDQQNLKHIDSASAEEKFFLRYSARRTHFFMDYKNQIANNIWEDVSMDMPLVERYFSLVQDFNIFKNEFFRNNKIPTFLALGLYDYSNPFYTWADRIKELSNVDYHIFSLGSHFPMLDEPQNFINILNHFLVKNGIDNPYYNFHKL